jgi:hypothetical protein
MQRDAWAKGIFKNHSASANGNDIVAGKTKGANRWKNR